MATKAKLKTQQLVEPQLVAIVGPTASGKSTVAMQIAREHGGEIICADSRTVYRGLDIGTAKPPKADQKAVPHHLLDVVNPDERFTVADFQKLANTAIADIQNRGKLPILVGGTGLYIDAVLYDYSLRMAVDRRLSEQYEKLSVPQLQTLIKERGLLLPKNLNNPRHLVRVLETGGQQPHKQELRPNTLVLGFLPPDDELKQRIARRAQQMIDDGLADEVKAVTDRYGWAVEPLRGVGYKEWQAYFTGKQRLEQVREQIITDTWQYARRQKTWFKRNPDIQWSDRP